MNQIDHIAYSKGFRRNVQDVVARRGADVGSDHYLVLAKVKLKLKRNFTGCVNSRLRFNTHLLKDVHTKEEFRITLSNRFQVLQEVSEEMSIEDKWNQIKSATISTCNEILGPKKSKHKEWISNNTIREIEDRRVKKSQVLNSRTREEKKRATDEYAQANDRVKKSAKKDKNEYFEGLAEGAEEAASHGDSQTLFATIKTLSGNFGKPEIPVKDKNGNALVGEDKQLERWMQHFRELLNRDPPEESLDIEEATEDLPINCEPPTKEEIERAIKQQKSGKASGPDEIPVEALKADLIGSTNMLYDLFQDIWKEEAIPEEWKEGYIIKIPKKGDLSSCSNYRGITLLCIASKIFNRVLLNRMKDVVNPILRDEQAGFRKGRSCTDQIATLRIILEQTLEWNSSIYVNFIDFEKAFDSVVRNTLWKLIRHLVHGTRKDSSPNKLI